MAFDDLERRCPRLGGEVRFEYCRTSGPSNEPCFKAIDCWWERFDVVSYFQNHLDQETFTHLTNPSPPNKVASLLELIEQAKARIGSEE